MPTPQKIEFFEKNLKLIEPMIEKENVSRAKRRLDPLTDEEIDSAIDDLIELSNSGQGFKGYVFKPSDQVPREARPEPAQMQPPTSKPTTELATVSTRFDISKCENGFLMVSGGVQYIFKTPKELMGILSGVVFGK